MKNTENFEKAYNKLNIEQKEAVDTIYWPIMVVAGPWTWKTQIIASRTANIILKTGINPENILITTFTESWVFAIKKRLLDFIHEESYKVNVCTIHSFCEDVIKTFPEKFIEEKTWVVIDEIDSIEILENVIDELDLEFLSSFWDKYFYLPSIKWKISDLKKEWINVKSFRKKIDELEESYNQNLEDLKNNKRIRDLEKRTAKDKETYNKHIWKLRELANIFELYQQKLKAKKMYDFNDMINYVLEKFRSDEYLRLYYAEKYQFIMLDEYQDTNNAQNEIIDLILESPIVPFIKGEENNMMWGNIMVVWDDDQSIYRFQWANIENILGFFTKYPETKVIVLKQNYRSNQQILDTASRLIENNFERISKRVNFIDKNLFSASKETSEVKVFNFSSDLEEKFFILEEINKSEEKLDEIAIIVRNNREVKEWNEFLEINWIETESKIKTNILESKYVNFLINFLEILNNPLNDDSKLLDILLSEIIDVRNIDILKLNKALYNENYTKNFKINLFEYLQDEEKLESLDLKEKDKIQTFTNLFDESLSLMKTTSLPEFFNILLEKFWILNFLEKNWSFDDLQDIFTLFNKIKSFTEINKDLNIWNFLNKLRLYKKHNQIIPRQILKKSSSWVQILTAHGSKWLEYNTVFIPSLNLWNWDNKKTIELIKLPNNLAWEWYQSLDKEDEKQKALEEERRLFFVAITRARKNLIISFPSSKENKLLMQSSFIGELESPIIPFIKGDVDSNILNIYILNSLKQNISKNNKNDELAYIEEFLVNYKLSPSDLNKFLEDPKVFLREAVFKYPFVDNLYTIFWKTYHRTLELFFANYKKHWKIPEKSYLEFTFSNLLKNEVLNPDQFKELLKKWLEWLNWYYDLNKNNFTSPLALEYNFRYKNIYFENVPLTGKIDKIELSSPHPNPFPWGRGDSSTELWGQLVFFKDAVNLVDYKTGSAKSLWQIKWIDKDWNKKESFSEGKYYRQLLFYKLLCELDRDFDSKFEINNLILDFVEWKDWNYRTVVVDYTKEDYEEFKNLVKDSWEKISNLDFWKKVLES